MLAWIAAQSAYLELAAGLQSMDDCASLLPRCADHGDQFLLLDNMATPFDSLSLFDGSGAPPLPTLSVSLLGQKIHRSLTSFPRDDARDD